MTEHLISSLRKLGIIYREPVVLKSGQTSELYVDVKGAYGYPEILRVICNALWEQMDKGTTCVAGAGYGGCSLATGLSLMQNLKLTLVREKPKQHGRGGWLDGHIPTSEDRVSIVDDVFTTGASLRNIIETIGPTGAEILGCHVVVKRGEGELEVPFFSLLTAEELL